MAVRSADPGELAERVRLLVGQPAAAEAADAVAARSAAGCDDRRRRSGRAPRPSDAGRSGLRPVAGNAADQRGQQPLRMVEQRRRGPALGAQAAAVGREVLLRLQRRRPVAGDHADPALQRAVRAVGQGGGGAHGLHAAHRGYTGLPSPLRQLHLSLTSTCRLVRDSDARPQGAGVAVALQRSHPLPLGATCVR